MSADPTGTDAPTDLEGRVARALELRDRGAPNWLQRACADDPSTEAAVRTAVESADALPAVLGESFTSDSRLGSVLAGRYLLERRLGAGAMGVVYEARDSELERRVAVKVLSAGLLERERAVQRFEREARAMAAVEHASIIAIHDRGRTTEGDAYLVMELVDGRQLGTLIEILGERSGSADAVDAQLLAEALGFELQPRESYVRVVVRWIAELAAGLATTHAAGVVHRDIKPSNVIVGRDGRAVLLDFGIAHLAASDPLTRGGTSLGTPAYMAPELLEVDAKATVRADVYGLSALLYSLLALQAPYRGTPQAILFALAHRDPTPLAKLHRGLPADLAAIVEKGMSRKPRDRYEDASALEADLQAFLDHRPVVARPIGPVRRGARRLMRSRTGRGAALAFAVVALAGASWAGRAAWLDHREASWVELYRHFPPNFTILHPRNRVLVHERDRRDLDALLDEAAAVCVDPLPTYLLRASFRLDHGRAAEAARDMALVARHEGTPFAAALAAAYAALPGDSAGSAAVDLSDLPAPRTARDRYLRGYHHLRAFEDPLALELLDEEVVAAVPHAQVLRFALRDLAGFGAADRYREALALNADVLRYEGRLGVRTASTAHFACYALTHAHAYQQALEVGTEGVELAPRTHVNRPNVGAAAFALGRYERARELLSVAAEVRPDDYKILPWLAWSHAAERDYASALETVADWAAGAPEAFGATTAVLMGEIELFQALNERWEDADPESVAACLARATGHFDRAQELGHPGPSSLVRALLEAVELEDEQAVFVSLARMVERQPRRFQWLVPLLAGQLPEELGSEATEALRGILRSIDELTRGDAAGSSPSSVSDTGQ